MKQLWYVGFIDEIIILCATAVSLFRLPWDTRLMHSEHHRFVGRITWYVITALITFAVPAFAQNDVPSALLKHVKTSRDLILKVAEQMPESTYGFKLTPPQMSFAEQLVHISQSFDEYLAPFAGEKPNPRKPASLSKKDVTAFVQQSFDSAVEKITKLTPAQLAKT